MDLHGVGGLADFVGRQFVGAHPSVAEEPPSWAVAVTFDQLSDAAVPSGSPDESRAARQTKRTAHPPLWRQDSDCRLPKASPRLHGPSMPSRCQPMNSRQRNGLAEGRPGTSKRPVAVESRAYRTQVASPSSLAEGSSVCKWRACALSPLAAIRIDVPSAPFFGIGEGKRRGKLSQPMSCAHAMARSAWCSAGSGRSDPDRNERRSERT